VIRWAPLTPPWAQTALAVIEAPERAWIASLSFEFA